MKKKKLVKLLDTSGKNEIYVVKTKQKKKKKDRKTIKLVRKND